MKNKCYNEEYMKEIAGSGRGGTGMTKLSTFSNLDILCTTTIRLVTSA